MMKWSQSSLVILIVFLILQVGSLFADEPTATNVGQDGSSGLKVSSTDWPRWRGPNADSVADGRNLPIHWNQTENNPLVGEAAGLGKPVHPLSRKAVFVTPKMIHAMAEIMSPQFLPSSRSKQARRATSCHLHHLGKSRTPAFRRQRVNWFPARSLHRPADVLGLVPMNGKISAVSHTVGIRSSPAGPVGPKKPLGQLLPS